MSKVSSGSVSQDPDCRICDLKREFNSQINASSAVIFVVGNKTAIRTAGSSCQRAIRDKIQCVCTPYKQNTNGTKPCKVSTTYTPGPNDDVGCINAYSFLRHEFEQAKRKGKAIIIVAETLIMYADVIRQEKNKDGSYTVGINAKKFTDDVLEFLFDRLKFD